MRIVELKEAKTLVLKTPDKGGLKSLAGPNDFYWEKPIEGLHFIKRSFDAPIYQGQFIWNWNGKAYYTSGGTHYAFDGNSWMEVGFVGTPPWAGEDVWYRGSHTYYTSGGTTYELTTGYNWKKVSLNGSVSSLGGSNIYVIGDRVFHSYNYNHYELIGDTWTNILWDNISFSFYGNNVWQADGHTYYSDSSHQFEFIDGEWVTKTWDTPIILEGQNVWEADGHIYNSRTETCELIDGAWQHIDIPGTPDRIAGYYIWHLGDRTFYSVGGNHYELKK